METEVLETPPPYVNCTAEQWAEAKATARRERLEPFFWFHESYAAIACEAQMTNGGYIEPVTAAHFRDMIEAKGYKVSPIYDERNAEQRRLKGQADKAAAAKVRADWEQRQREARGPFRFQSLQQAAALLSPMEYNEYCLSQEGQLLAQQYNKALYGLF
jgi:hypothetical protein